MSGLHYNNICLVFFSPKRVFSQRGHWPALSVSAPAHCGQPWPPHQPETVSSRDLLWDEDTSQLCHQLCQVLEVTLCYRLCSLICLYIFLCTHAHDCFYRCVMNRDQCPLVSLLTAQPTLYREVHLTSKVEVFQRLLFWRELLQSVFMSGNVCKVWCSTATAPSHCDNCVLENAYWLFLLLTQSQCCNNNEWHMWLYHQGLELIKLCPFLSPLNCSCIVLLNIAFTLSLSIVLRVFY